MIIRTATCACRNLRVTCADSSLDCEQEIAGIENALTGHIRMQDASSRIDKAHPRTDAIERVGERRGFDGLEIDMPADKHCPANVQHDKAHALAYFIVDHAIAFVAKYSEQCRAAY